MRFTLGSLGLVLIVGGALVLAAGLVLLHEGDVATLGAAIALAGMALNYLAGE